MGDPAGTSIATPVGDDTLAATTLTRAPPAAVAFSSGKIEAWATFGTYQANAEIHGARVLRDGVGINSGIGVIAASDAALADPGKRAALADVLRRLALSNTWANAHPKDCLLYTSPSPRDS